jgi:predicted TIM-barrel fold metal-dependent hydrolase
MQGLRELEQAVKEFSFVGAHLYPHWFGLPPDHAKYYPYYAKCCELDIPIMMQVGHNLVYQRDRRLPSVGRPICLDQVAIDFPELKLLGIHIGVPWADEMISMAWKHENIFIGVDAYAPKHWPAQLVHYLDSYGRTKVLFGTDWPVIDPERAVAEIGQLAIRPESRRALMRDNALRVFRLPESAGNVQPLRRPGAGSSGVSNPRDLVVRPDGSIGVRDKQAGTPRA